MTLTSGFTRQERMFLSLMKAWSVVFVVLTIVFAWCGDWVLNQLTRTSILLLGMRTRIPNFGEERFWQILAVTHFLVMAFLCWQTARDRLRHLGYAEAVILGKAVSTIGFFVCFFFIENLFVYLLAGVVDALMCTLTWYSFYSANRSHPSRGVM